jgi:hypothetical protein
LSSVLRQCPGIQLDRLKKIIQEPWNFKQVPNEYKYKILLLRPEAEEGKGKAEMKLKS